MGEPVLVVTVPGRPPTPNARRHWHVIAKDNAKWKAIAQQAAEKALTGRDWTPLALARITIEFVLPDRAHRDLDNLVSSIKPCSDGIVAAGVLVDDSMDVIQALTFEWRYQRGVAATVYRIEGVAPKPSMVLDQPCHADVLLKLANA